MQDALSGPSENIEAVRFLWTMVAVSAGIVDLVDCHLGPDGEWFVCQNKATGTLINVFRPHSWTEEEERRYVDELDRALNDIDVRDDELDSLFDATTAEPELAVR